MLHIKKCLHLFQTPQHSILLVLSILLTLNTFGFAGVKASSLHIASLPYFSPNIYYTLYLLLGTLTLGTLFFFMQRVDYRTALIKLLVTLFPMILLLGYAMGQSKHFHIFFHLSVGAYFITSGILLLLARHRSIIQHDQSFTGINFFVTILKRREFECLTKLVHVAQVESNRLARFS